MRSVRARAAMHHPHGEIDRSLHRGSLAWHGLGTESLPLGHSPDRMTGLKRRHVGLSTRWGPLPVRQYLVPCGAPYVFGTRACSASCDLCSGPHSSDMAASDVVTSYINLPFHLPRRIPFWAEEYTRRCRRHRRRRTPCPQRTRDTSIRL